MGGAAISPLSMAQVALEAEPEGGEELTIIDSMPGCRMKNMGEDTETKSDDEDSTVYNFWFTATVEASLIKSVRNSIEKDASKEANFPGFRKVSKTSYKLFIFCSIILKTFHTLKNIIFKLILFTHYNYRDKYHHTHNHK